MIDIIYLQDQDSTYMILIDTYMYMVLIDTCKLCNLHSRLVRHCLVGFYVI